MPDRSDPTRDLADDFVHQIPDIDPVETREGIGSLERGGRGRGAHAAEALGAHLSAFPSSAILYEVGFNHFFHGKEDGLPGDHVYFQGHAAPGIYARAYLERRLDETHLDRFRREVGGGGLSSYPHPRPMPAFSEC